VGSNPGFHSGFAGRASRRIDGRRSSEILTKQAEVDLDGGEETIVILPTLEHSARTANVGF
jgi:hypothetical protein